MLLQRQNSAFKFNSNVSVMGLKMLEDSRRSSAVLAEADYEQFAIKWNIFITSENVQSIFSSLWRKLIFFHSITHIFAQSLILTCLLLLWNISVKRAWMSLKLQQTTSCSVSQHTGPTCCCTLGQLLKLLFVPNEYLLSGLSFMDWNLRVGASSTEKLTRPPTHSPAPAARDN